MRMGPVETERWMCGYGVEFTCQPSASKAGYWWVCESLFNIERSNFVILRLRLLELLVVTSLCTMPLPAMELVKCDLCKIITCERCSNAIPEKRCPILCNPLIFDMLSHVNNWATNSGFIYLPKNKIEWNVCSCQLDLYWRHLSVPSARSPCIKESTSL